MDKILITQKEPSVLDQYNAISKKYKVEFTFRPFFHIEPVESIEFRAQRVDVLSHSAVVFTSKTAIDGFFQVCEEHRVTIPQTMKYFCTSELIANYLQKHIVYRKRKIFFGDGSVNSIFTAIGTKHAGENFLVVCCNTTEGSITKKFEEAGLKHTDAVFVKSVSSDLSDLDLSQYKTIVMYNAADVQSIADNFPGYSQGDTKIISYGKTVVKPLQDAGYEIALEAPCEGITSIPAAIEAILKKKK